MAQNRKKGMAKRALSVSLVAAMLATSNTPAWASGFVNENEDGVQAFFNEISDEIASENDAVLAVAESDFDSTSMSALTSAISTIGVKAWDEVSGEMKGLLDVARSVKQSENNKISVYGASVGIADKSAIDDSDGTLDLSVGEFTEWTSSKKFDANAIDKVIAVKLVLKNGDKPYYIAGSNKITGVKPADAVDWSVKVNNTTFKKNEEEKVLPAAADYQIKEMSFTLRDGQTVKANGMDLTSEQLSVDYDEISDGKITLAFQNSCLGFTDDAFEITGITKEGDNSLTGKVSIADKTLVYDPSLPEITAKAKDLVTVTGLFEDEYNIVLAGDEKGTALTNVPAAGDEVWVVVKGAAGSEYGNAKPVAKAFTVAKKNLSTLYVNQEVLENVIYDDTKSDVNDYWTAIKDKVFKYYGETDEDFDFSTNGTELDATPTGVHAAGETVKVTVLPEVGNKNFAGKKEISFVLKADDISDNLDLDLQTAIEDEAFTYDTRIHSVNQMLKDGFEGEETGLRLDRSDFTLSCVEVPSGQIVDAGEYTIKMTVTAGAYKGATATATLEVDQADLNVFENGRGVTFAPISWAPDMTDSTELKDDARVKLTFNGKVLEEGVDYKVTSVLVDPTGTNVTAGDPIVLTLEDISTAKTNFTLTGGGECTIGKVQKRQLPELPEIPVQKYADAKGFETLKAMKADGTEGTYQDVIVAIKGEALELDTTYEAKFIDPMPANGEGQRTLRIYGIGNYGGYVDKVVTITKAELDAAFYYVDGTTGAYKTELPGIKYKHTAALKGMKFESTDFNAANENNSTSAWSGKIVVLDKAGKNIAGSCNFVYENNTEVGTATIKAVGKTGNTVHAVATFEVLPQQIEEAVVVITPEFAEDGYHYTGEEIQPETKITVKDKDGTYTLKENVDYVVSYENNVKVADKDADDAPAMVIKGMGNYTFVDTETPNTPKVNTGAHKKFAIIATDLTNANVTVKNVTYAGGLEVTPDIAILNPYSGKALVKDVDYTLTLTNAVNVGAATATIKLTKEGAKNYTINAAAADTLDVNFRILPKNLADCTAAIVDGKIVIKNGDVTVAEKEYDAKENEDGSITATAKAGGNYTGSITASAVKAPAATQAKVTAKTTSSVTVSWDAVEGAEGYTIWYHSEKDTANTRKIITGGDITSWTQKGLAAGTKYFYTVKAWVKDAEGKYVFGEETSYVRGTTMPMKAKIAKVTATNGMVKVALADAAAGAEKYSMCYSLSSDFASFKVGVRTSYTTRTFTNALTKGTYYVRVKSYRDLGNNKRIYGAWSNTVKVVVK